MPDMTVHHLSTLLVLLGICLQAFAKPSPINIEDMSELEEIEKELLKRIVGGDSQISEGDWPSLVSLQAKVPGTKFLGFILSWNRYYCAGALVSNGVILTAASCFTQASGLGDKSVWRAKIGSHDLTDSFFTSLGSVVGNALGIKDIVEYNMNINSIHTLKRFNPDNPQGGYDLAFLKLKETLPSAALEALSIGIAKLPDDDLLNLEGEFPHENTTCYVAGWGCSKKGGGQQEVGVEMKLPIVSREECNERYTNVGIGDKHLCAGGHKEDAGLCKGDAGVPLYCWSEYLEDWVLVGTGSFGYSQPRVYDKPIVFTRLEMFSNTIKTIIDYL